MLGVIKAGEEDAIPAFNLIGNDLPLLQFEPHRLLDDGRGDVEELDRHRQEFVARQAAMAVIEGFAQGEGDPRPRADHRRLLNAELHRNSVGGAKTNAADIAGEPIGVLGDQLDRIGAIGLEDAHGP